MKLGICLPHYGRPIEPSRLAQIAARAEEMGLDSIWVTDHVIVPRDISLIYRNDMLDPLAMLPWLAGVTERIALGTSVIVLPYRSPLPVAKLLASVDVLSGGRLIVGVAVGWVEGEFEALNVPFRERGRRTDEAIRVIRMLWTQDEVTFHGEFYKLDRISVLPKPWQNPPPIWIGGKSEAAQKRTARLGDGWMPSFITPDEFRAGVERVQELAAAEEREVPADHFGTLINFALADSPEAAAAMAGPFIPRGRVDEATIRQCTAFGPPEVVAGRIEDYVKGGGSKFILRPLCPPDAMLDQLARLSAEVIPAFHAR